MQINQNVGHAVTKKLNPGGGSTHFNLDQLLEIVQSFRLDTTHALSGGVLDTTHPLAHANKVGFAYRKMFH